MSPENYRLRYNIPNNVQNFENEKGISEFKIKHRIEIGFNSYSIFYQIIL